MTKTSKNHKTDLKSKKKYNFYTDDEQITLNDIKRDRHMKQHRNYDNALRSKNLDRLLSYEDD